MKQIQEAIQKVSRELFDISITPELTRPDEQFGDYATNIALQLAGTLNKNPRAIAESIAARLREDLKYQVSDVMTAGPGFINLWLHDEVLIEAVRTEKVANLYENQQVLVEFGDPNPLKAMHLGHLYTTVVGDSIARLFTTGGASVKRLSYHGDVGMHVAKAIWAIGEQIEWNTERLYELEQAEINLDDKVLTIKTVIGYLYAKGATAFEDDPNAEARIREINASAYRRDDTVINAIYDWGVARSFTYFDLIFKELGVTYDKRYLESEATPIGIDFVRQNTPKVFEESNGAIIYRGEKVGLHTRVFINSEGLPTYEAKDLGLAELKKQDFPEAQKSIIITANEQTEYFRVMLAALGEFDPEVAAKTQHISHGFLSLTTGKMSSRSGKVFGAQELLDATLDAVKTAYPDSKVQREVYLAAIKYTFLRNRIGGDIVFDIQESVTLEGNSGPYLQYAHARAKSILRKSEDEAVALKTLDAAERSLLRKISEYPEVINKAVTELMPHHIGTYLYELAQNFNRFYEQNRVIGDMRQKERLTLVTMYADTLASGLELLGIPAPEEM